MLSASEAAKRSNRAALAAVGAAHDEVHRATEAITRYNSADVGIREALALASGNQMLALLLESLSESLHHSFAQGFSGFMDGGGNILDALAEHPRIYDLVAAGDPAGAARAMRQHLDSTARDLQVFLRGADSSS